MLAVCGSQKQFAIRINLGIRNYKLYEIGAAFNNAMLFYRWPMINVEITPNPQGFTYTCSVRNIKSITQREIVISKLFTGERRITR